MELRKDLMNGEEVYTITAQTIDADHFEVSPTLLNKGTPSQ